MVGILICALIRPSFVAAGRSISTFGTAKATIIPYALTILGTSFWLFKASSELSSSNPTASKIASALIIISLTLVANLLVPFSINRLFHYTHDVISMVYFGFILYISLLLILHSQKNILSHILFILEIVGSILLVLSLKKVNLLKLQFISELVVVVSFIFLLMGPIS